MQEDSTIISWNVGTREVWMEEDVSCRTPKTINAVIHQRTGHTLCPKWYSYKCACARFGDSGTVSDQKSSHISVLSPAPVKRTEGKKYKKKWGLCIAILYSAAVSGLMISLARADTFLIGDARFLFWEFISSQNISAFGTCSLVVGSKFYSLALHCIYIT